jgi:hypothetical protein
MERLARALTALVGLPEILSRPRKAAAERRGRRVIEDR